jgi:hypothetical protein
MSEPKSRQPIVRALGLYLAGSWVCLQVVDVLAQNFALPSWAFLLTLVLLVIGLPITGATAFLQSRLRGAAGEERMGLEHRLLTWPNVVRAGVGALAARGHRVEVVPLQQPYRQATSGAGAVKMVMIDPVTGVMYGGVSPAKSDYVLGR